MKKMYPWLVLALLGFCASPIQAQKNEPPLKIWTVDNDDDGSYAVLSGFVDQYNAQNKTQVTLEFRDVETLRVDYVNAIQAEAAPDLVVTVSDHVGPFSLAGAVLPLDGLLDLTAWDPQALALMKTNAQWGIPLSLGGHLMLFYHKSMVPVPPKDTNELIDLGKKLSKGNTYALVFNQQEPFWLAPWLSGFGGSFFDPQGKPALNSKAMVEALTLYQDLRLKHEITPLRTDYSQATQMFMKKDLATGKYQAAMIINGDWALMTYVKEFPDLGIAPIPRVSATELPCRPFGSTKGLMISAALKNQPARLQKVLDLLKFLTSKGNLQTRAAELSLLPPRLDLQSEMKFSSDPRIHQLQKDSLTAARLCLPLPQTPAMKHVWDTTRAFLDQMFERGTTPEETAENMQTGILQSLNWSKGKTGVPDSK